MLSFIELVKKYGMGPILAAATLDSYRRTWKNDGATDPMNEAKTAMADVEATKKELFNIAIEEQLKKEDHKKVLYKYKVDADTFSKAYDDYSKNPSEANKKILDEQRKKMDQSLEDIFKMDISQIFIDIYDKYVNYLSHLSPDKIVCLFNIIIDGLILNSFFTILSLALSQNFINRITFLEKYPKLLSLLNLRNNINKKISKLYFFVHFFFIILGLLGNLYMFFLTT